LLYILLLFGKDKSLFAYFTDLRNLLVNLFWPISSSIILSAMMAGKDGALKHFANCTDYMAHELSAQGYVGKSSRKIMPLLPAVIA
jgi:hypothetical protein